MSSPQLVYVDTSVLGFALLPHNKNSQHQVTYARRARAFLHDINIGRYRGIISTLTELEYLGAAKRLITMDANRPITKQEEDTAMKDLKKYTIQLGIGLGDSDVLAIDNLGNPNLVSNSKSIMVSSIPYYHPHGKDPGWKQIGGTDALTVNIAIQLNAQLIATFDRGFAGLNNPSIKPLIVQDRYKHVN